jgi:hypothetical protein
MVQYTMPPCARSRYCSHGGLGPVESCRWRRRPQEYVHCVQSAPVDERRDTTLTDEVEARSSEREALRTKVFDAWCEFEAAGEPWLDGVDLGPMQRWRLCSRSDETSAVDRLQEAKRVSTDRHARKGPPPI